MMVWINSLNVEVRENFFFVSGFDLVGIGERGLFGIILVIDIDIF